MLRKIWLSVVCVFLCTLMLVFAFQPADAATSTEIRDQINAMEQEQESLRQEMEKLEGQIRQNADEMKDLVANKAAIGNYSVLNIDKNLS